MGKILKNISVFFLVCCMSCSLTPIRYYDGKLTPLVGTSKKLEIDYTLGSPVYCKPAGDNEICRYRTSIRQNRPIPDMYRKTPGMGPDLSPNEYFDDLDVTFSKDKVLKEWKLR